MLYNPVTAQTVWFSLQRNVNRFVPHSTHQIQFLGVPHIYLSKRLRVMTHSCLPCGKLYLYSFYPIIPPSRVVHITHFSSRNSLLDFHYFFVSMTYCNSWLSYLFIGNIRCMNLNLVHLQLCVRVSNSSCGLIPSPGVRANLFGATAD